MKWSIFGLLFFGIVAAVSAAVLVTSLRASTRPRGNGEVEFLVAAADLPRSKILDPDSITVKRTPAKDAPEGCLTNPVQVIGKVLSIPMVEGQPFTRACFASEGSGYRVASVLPDGMRAVSLSLFDYAGLFGLLYAGCTVDVLVALKIDRSGSSCDDALSVPLLQGVQVLAVEGETLVSGKTAEEGKKSTNLLKKLLVTLMVDAEQAAALQLAMQNGNVSLALRNPMDKAPVQRVPKTLAELLHLHPGYLAGRKPAGSGVSTLGWLSGLGRKLGEALQKRPIQRAGTVPASLSDGPRSPASSPATSPQPDKPEKKKLWEITVIRGSEVTTQPVPEPSEKANGI